MGRRGIQIEEGGLMERWPVWDWTDGKDLAWARWTATLGGRQACGDELRYAVREDGRKMKEER
jgi:hypothetical protein